MNTVIKKLALVSLLLIAVWFIPETVQAVVRINAGGSLSVSGPGDTPAGATVSVSISGSNMKNWTLYRYAGSACSPSYVWGCSSSIIKSGSGNPIGNVNDTVPNLATAVFYKLGGTDTSGQEVKADSSLFYVYKYGISILSSPSTYNSSGSTIYRVEGRECNNGSCGPKSGLSIVLYGSASTMSCGIGNYDSKSTDSSGIAEFKAASGSQIGYVIFSVKVESSQVGGAGTFYSGAELASLSVANTSVNTGQSASVSYQAKNMFGSTCDSSLIPTVTLTNWNYQVLDPAGKIIKESSGSSSQGGDIDFTPTAVGNYTVKLETTQSNGYKESKSLTITAKQANNPPIIDSFTCASPITLSSGKADSTCTITAHDPDAGDTITDYAITRTTGANAPETKSGSSATFTFTKDGSYTMNAAVKDSKGAQATQKSFTITVNKEPANACAGNQAPQNVSVSATPTCWDGNFYMGGGNAIVVYSLDGKDPDGNLKEVILYDNGPHPANNPIFKDTNPGGSRNYLGTNANTTYATDGAYTANWIMNDQCGFQSSSSVAITVKAGNCPSQPGGNQAPSADVSAEKGFSNFQVDVHVTINDPEAKISDSEINYGDGTIYNLGSVNLNNVQYYYTYSSPGNYTITISVTDDKNQTATDSVSVSIPFGGQPVNQAPSVSISAPATAQTGQQVTFTINVSDPNGASDIKAWSLDSNELSVLTSGNSAETNKPFKKTFNSAGTIHYVLQAEDKSGAVSNQATGTLIITAPAGQALTMDSCLCNPNSFDQTQSTTCSLSASGGSTPYTYSYTSTGPRGSTITNNNGSFSGFDGDGSYSVACTVTDSKNATASGSSNYSVSTSQINQPPNQPSNPNPPHNATNVVPENSKTLSWAGGDPDGDSLIYHIYFGNSSDKQTLRNNKIKDTSSTSATTNANAQNHDYYWFVSSEDAEYVVEGPVWKFTTSGPVAPANNQPVLNPIGNKSTDEFQQLAFRLSASDPDGDSLAYSGQNLPSLAVLNSATGEFFWTPSCSQGDDNPSVYNITFSVSDGRAGQDSETITITVNDTASCAPPPVPQQLIPGLPIWRQIIPF